MGKRNRQRSKLKAPTSTYDGGDAGALELRGSMTPATRLEYAETLHDLSRQTEDSWHRAVEFLFERLAVTWTISDVTTKGQKPLLMRFRMATQEERAFIRDALRQHLAEWFPDLEAP
ncbi:MAG: hypothetical protein JHC95_02725 [Solirubrobacteraceae bacterium]|nr:hypothetical protein [Solirubrobacteraceae bacterium]